MQYMHMILSIHNPHDCGVAINLRCHKQKRIDFIITGHNEESKHQAIIIELKQWSEVYPLPNIDMLLESDHCRQYKIKLIITESYKLLSSILSSLVL